MLPLFHGERMRAYEEIIAELARWRWTVWPIGETFAIHPHMQALTLEVIMRAVFGVSVPRARRSATALFLDLLAQTTSPVLQLRSCSPGDSAVPTRSAS